MDMVNYRKREGLSQAQFAQILTAAGHPASQALVSQWESGAVVLSAERCAQVERVTAGVVTRADLRPDIFGALEPFSMPDAADASEPVRAVGR